MCGVVGFYFKKNSSLSSINISEINNTCAEMLRALKFRGPDEQDMAQLGNAFLGHSRLSIIDLTTGSQPIYNEDKSIAVVLNGEIYNFQELRKNLIKKGHKFHTKSDTEVIVHLYEEVGENVFSYLNGMFAILIYDLKLNVLLVARDRMGEKPLLYWESKDKVVIASEIKALLKHPEISGNVDVDALALFFNSMYVPAPYSIISGIKKLPPAHFLKLQGDTNSLVKYWDPQPQVQWGLSEEEIKDRFLEIFSSAVKNRMIADVPLGVFLSGGIDSSAVTAFMAQHSTEPIKTFAVGFANEIDERPFARIVAKRYSTDHTELFVENKIEDVVPDVLSYFDEPFGDSSAIPTHLVAREARKHVKVVLTGDGGDELFAGYDSYLNQKYLFGGRITTKILKTLNRLSLKKIGCTALDGIYARKGNLRSWEHWHWVRTVMTRQEIDKVLCGYGVDITKFFPENHWIDLPDKDPLSVAFCHDLNFYLPDDLLKKVDMASMKASLECRAPFLDHRLVEFAMTIPPHLKVKKEQLKYFLKLGLADFLPREILYRKKTGFGAPVASWMKNQLKEMVCDLLQRGCMCENYLQRQGIDTAMERFYKSATVPDYRIPFKLWLLFVFELWLRNYSSKKAAVNC